MDLCGIVPSGAAMCLCRGAADGTEMQSPPSSSSSHGQSPFPISMGERRAVHQQSLEHGWGLLLIIDPCTESQPGSGCSVPGFGGSPGTSTQRLFSFSGSGSTQGRVTAKLCLGCAPRPWQQQPAQHSSTERGPEPRLAVLTHRGLPELQHRVALLGWSSSSGKGHLPLAEPGGHLQRAEVVSPSSWQSTSATGRGHVPELSVTELSSATRLFTASQ